MTAPDAEPFHEVLRRAADESADRVAIHEDGGDWTYSELELPRRWPSMPSMVVCSRLGC